MSPMSPAPGPSGLSSAPGGRAFPSGSSETPRGISGPQALSYPAVAQPGAPLTYRAGEDSRLRASQSMDPMDPGGRGSAPFSLPQSMPQPSGMGSVSGMSSTSGRSGASSGIRSVPSAYSSSGTQSMTRQSGSRFWIVAVIILAVLAIAAIVLLRMAQAGVFLSL